MSRIVLQDCPIPKGEQMTRLLSIAALSMALSSAAVFAQEANRQETQATAQSRQSTNPCANLESNPNRTHALVELCNWIGQYR